MGASSGSRWHTPAELYAKLKPLGRQMRKDPTPAEDTLWQAVRKHQVAGLKFRRQHSIGQFIVDFYCSDLRLIVEVDGPVHDFTGEQDAVRQASTCCASRMMRFLSGWMRCWRRSGGQRKGRGLGLAVLRPELQVATV